jgi:hypothetical protein
VVISGMPHIKGIITQHKNLVKNVIRRKRKAFQESKCPHGFHFSKCGVGISLLKVWLKVWSGHFTFGNACVLPMKNFTLQKGYHLQIDKNFFG